MYKDIKTRYFYHAVYNSIMYGIHVYASFNHDLIFEILEECMRTKY